VWRGRGSEFRFCKTMQLTRPQVTPGAASPSGRFVYEPDRSAGVGFVQPRGDELCRGRPFPAPQIPVRLLQDCLAKTLPGKCGRRPRELSPRPGLACRTPIFVSTSSSFPGKRAALEAIQPSRLARLHPMSVLRAARLKPRSLWSQPGIAQGHLAIAERWARRTSPTDATLRHPGLLEFCWR
jgi:hypothetical protein